MSNKVQVHEFCRAFDNVKYSDEYKEWVSGGYSPKKIANYDVEVPTVIQKAVRDGYFSINDNFPPENEGYSIIARELSTNEDNGKIYSILAIANRQIDDAGRPTIGYKYFWTDAHDSELDGIVQLLLLWYVNKRVSFKMQELDTSYQRSKVRLSSNISISSKDRTHKIIMDNIYDLIDNDLQYNQYSLQMSKAVNYLNTGKYEDIPSEVDFYKTHCLALFISRKLKNDNVFSFCSWAFYVMPAHLVYPTSFACVNDKNGFFCINNNAKELLRKISIQSSSLTTLPENLINREIIPVHIEESIKKTLIDISKGFAGKTHRIASNDSMEDFFQYLIDYENASWSDCIDHVMIKQNILPYNAVVYLVNSDIEYKEKWLESFFVALKTPGFFSKYFLNSFKDKQSFSTPLYIHTKLMDSANFKAEEILIESFLFGITWLLENKCLENEGEINKRKLQYLFLESKSVWSKIFVFFANQVLCELERYDNQQLVTSKHIKYFLNSIFDDIESSNNHAQNSKSEYIIGRYQRLDCFFKKLFKRNISEIINDKYHQDRERKKRVNQNSAIIIQHGHYGSFEHLNKKFLGWRLLTTFTLTLLVITVVFIAFSSNVHDDKTIPYEKDGCEANSIKNLGFLKKCYGQNSTMQSVLEDINKELFPKPGLRRNPQAYPYEAAEYLKNSLDENDYKRRRLKVTKCSMENENFNQCLNSDKPKP